MGSQLVPLEQGDLVTVKAQTLGDGAPDDPTSDDDDARHIRKWKGLDSRTCVRYLRTRLHFLSCVSLAEAAPT